MCWHARCWVSCGGYWLSPAPTGLPGDGVLLQMEWLEDFVLNELVLSGETYVLQSGEPGRTRL